MRVVISTPFTARLAEIETFLKGADAEAVFDRLLDAMRRVIFPNLAAHPLIGAALHGLPNQTVRTALAASRLPDEVIESLRVYLHGDFQLLYTVQPDEIVLISIRHHRQLSFQAIHRD